jgi:hypothetical protein
MTAFKKFDPHAFLEREGLVPDSAKTLAALATLAGRPLENEIRITPSPMSQWDIDAPPAKSIEPRRDDPSVEHGLDQLGKNQNLTPTPAKVAKAAKVNRPDFGVLSAAFDALHSKCPAHVPEDRWRQAVEDATAFTSQWGTQAQTFGWTERELFGLHSVPEQPAANYSRLSRLDETGLIWLLRGRPVITVTATEAVMRCRSGATLVYRRQNNPVPGSVGLGDMGLTT